MFCLFLSKIKKRKRISILFSILLLINILFFSNDFNNENELAFRICEALNRMKRKSKKKK
jgi:hypothetical protein